MNRGNTAKALILAAALAACGGGDAPPDTADQATPEAAAAAGGGELTQVELEQGLGPIRDLELGPVDEGLAAQGEDAFVLKCSACHKIEERYVAPELGTVLSRRRPEFVMNMMLNASEMVQRHPEVQALLAEYFTPMTVQVTEEQEALAILEYLRTVQIENP
jgi:hypothetical protein